MTNHNFGVIKATFTNYLNESENLLAKEMFGKFMMMIKESVGLRLQFDVYKNIENKYIPNENLAIKYIDENINLFTSKRNINILRENARLSPLVEGLKIRVSEQKRKLYEHINTLIVESISPNTNVDKLHESYAYILEYIKNNKCKISESTILTPSYNPIPKEFLIKTAIDKFNQKYTDSLNESDQSILKSIMTSDVNEKERVFISIKEETLTSLKSLLSNSGINPTKINESVEKITMMPFNAETYSHDVLTLNDLKSDITQ